MTKNQRNRIKGKLAWEYCTNLNAGGNRIPAWAVKWWHEEQERRYKAKLRRNGLMLVGGYPNGGRAVARP